MNVHRRWRRLAVLLPLMALALLGQPLTHAQEPPPEPPPPAPTPAPPPPEEPSAPQPSSEERSEPPPSDLLVEFEGWVAQPAGLEFFPATQNDPNNTVGTRLLQTEYGTESEARVRAAYRLPGGAGLIGGTYYSHDAESALEQFSPGSFVFGEQLTHPLLAGFNNDGLADAFESASLTALRDWRVDFQRPAFSTARVTGDWFIGWRRVSHRRAQAAIYHALVPDLPPLVPPLTAPRPDLNPLPDVASISSRFEGRGPAAGFDVDFPLWKGKLLFEGGLSVAVLRGETDASYTALNSFYVVNAPEIGLDNVILGPPYGDEFEFIYPNPTDPNLPPLALIDSITQRQAAIGLQAQRLSSTSQVLESYLGFRWKLLRRFEFYGGFRSTRYDDVGVDLRPKVATPTFTEDGNIIFNVQDVTQDKRSATYEGLYLGVTVHLF